MKNILKYITLTIAFTISIQLLSHAQKNGPAFRVIADKLSDGSGFAVDSIAVRWETPSFIAKTTAAGYISLKPDQNGKIEFKLPYSSELTPFRIHAKKNKNRALLSLGYFLAESSDDILIKIAYNGSNFSYTYSGHGAEKYNIDTDLRNLIIQRSSFKVIREPGELNAKLIKLHAHTQESLRQMNELISRSRLNSDMQKVISYESRYSVTSPWFTYLYETFKNSKNLEVRSLAKALFSVSKNEFYPIDSLVNLSPTYMVALAHKDGYDLSINASSDTVKIVDFYHLIRTKYSGKTRDMMLANFLTAGIGFNKEVLNGYDQVVIDSLSKDAFNSVELPTAKKRFMEQVRLNRGAKVPEVSFLDLNGNLVSLASLKGKVIMLDLWSTGCTACALFHQWFHKEIYPSYKNNKDFIYLSINGDKTKERWEAALKTGRYSSDDYLNLNFGEGVGMNHPFTKYYIVGSFPFIMVIGKDGKVYAASVPKDKVGVKKILDGALMRNPAIYVP